jgi:hypothetical protein
MKLRSISLEMVGLVSAVLLGIAPVTHADDRDAGKACSNATLNGSYGFYRTGTTPTGPLASIGILFFDGNGNATATQSTSRNGVFTFDVVVPGTYEVAEDCTGKEFTPNGVEFARIVIVGGGKGFYLFSETAGNTVYGVGRKIHKPEHDHDH